MDTDRYVLLDDGTIDTVILDTNSNTEHRFSTEFAAIHRDEMGFLNMDSFLSDRDWETLY